ncbi:ABC transporter substrate-binding protein [Alicyclobacillus fastidiosus]|uniref:ABC transporter substrate-binding protein n=1 Tax=Alicyclobacillus fastidiosus TaxID=392011 RepID=A0ABY6ZMV0_9BACL|nr:ABC transporter substrate-binding protein [Alicyclobacillus fastidiosus]WAH43893.1 ABC transporter substrate-binding protein [Alicyclobacillus fastidiosus]GMA60137.1 ABC transporter substrate-binding protein [Alicyclobacillus fastidiosus]
MNRTYKVLSFLACVAAISTTVVGCGTSTTQNTAGNSTSSNAASTKTTAFPVTLTDDSGAKVTVSAKPMHIASGTEGTDEILSALVPKSRIALVTNYSSDPTYSNVVAQVKGIPQMADADPEKILSVHPDLVLLASYTKAGVVTQVRNAGVPVYEFNDFNSVNDIEKNIKVVGELVGEDAKATQLVNHMNSQIKSIQSAVAGDAKPTVLDYSSYGFAAGSSTTVNEMITDAGGTNAAGSLGGWAKVTDEQLVKMNPDVIIDSSDDQAFLQKLAKQPDLQSITAIKEHHLYSIDSADLSSVSQSIVRGIADIAKVLHPNAQIPDVASEE